MKIKKTEHVVTAWADNPSGPGWSNQLVWVLIFDGAKGTHRVDCFQPSEQTEDMQYAFEYALLAGKRLTRAVESALKRRGGVR